MQAPGRFQTCRGCGKASAACAVGAAPISAMGAGRTQMNRHAGFSLTELAMVLGVVGIIVAGIMLFYAGASEKAKSSEWLTEVGSIRSAINSLSGGSAIDINADWTTLVLQSKMLPAKYVQSSQGQPSGLVGPWHSEAEILPFVIYDQPYLAILTTNMPDSACAALAAMDVGQTFTYTVTAISAGPMTPANAGVACTGIGGTVAGYLAYFYPLNDI